MLLLARPSGWLHAQGEDSLLNNPYEFFAGYESPITVELPAGFFVYRFFAPQAGQLNYISTHVQANALHVVIPVEMAALYNPPATELSADPISMPVNYASLDGEQYPSTAIPLARSILVAEDRLQTDQFSPSSRLVTSQDRDVSLDKTDRSTGGRAALIQDELRIEERQVVLPSNAIANIDAPASQRSPVEFVAEANQPPPVSVEGTSVSLLTPEEKARRAAIDKKMNYRVVDLSEFDRDPLDYEAKVSTAVMSQQSAMITKQASLSTEGTASSGEEIAYTPTPHAPTRFIVKFKDNWPNGLEACAQKIHTLGLEFKDYLSDGSSSIDQLNRICRVQKVKSLFMKRGHLNTMDAQTMQKEKVKHVKERFKSRAKRNDVEVPIPDLINTYVFEVPEGSDIEKIVELYAQDPHVEFAQPDYVVVPNVFPATAPNDPRYATHKWDLNNTGQFGGVVEADIRAALSWPLNLGDGMIVAVVDGGIDYNHADLADNIWINPGEDLNSNGVVDGSNMCPTISGDFNCVDDDGNGQTDDIRGYDFGDDDNDPIFFSEIGVTDWHGTFVSGMIAAVTDNATLIPSIAPNAKIMIAKGFADTGVTTSASLASAIVYAAMNGADVINNSWGCEVPCPSNPVAESAVATAYGLGAVIVFAAGNDALDVADFSPQNMKPEVITVAATNNKDERASFSNVGALLDVSAPGDDVYSISPFDQFAVASGTSFSAPLTSGVAALILSEHPTMTNAQVRWILRYSADDIDAFGFDDNTGAGRVNAFEALTLTKVLPVLFAIGDRSVTTGFILEFPVNSFDTAGDDLTLEAELVGGASLGTIGASFTDNGDGTGFFSWAPTAIQAGLDPDIVFTVTDAPGGFTDSETITITVILGAGVCGNGGPPEPGEQCDDGNTDPGDGCSRVCLFEVCGNVIIDVGEQCDNDPGPVSGDGCTNACVLEICGDNIINNPPFEECDDGVPTPTCSATCLSIICGNNRIDVGEDCDNISDPLCDPTTCTWLNPTCGDGNQTIGEQCDDGNTANGDGCNNLCIDEFCGDGIVNDTNEDCDPSAIIPPSSFDGDGCSAICEDQFCGNGVVDVILDEECDDDNGTSGDGCSSVCLREDLAVCGNDLCESGRAETCATCFADCGYCRGLRPR